jgi:hypothetical protein
VGTKLIQNIVSEIWLAFSIIKKNEPVVLPDMILHCLGAASNIVSNVIGVS